MMVTLCLYNGKGTLGNSMGPTKLDWKNNIDFNDTHRRSLGEKEKVCSQENNVAWKRLNPKSKHERGGRIWLSEELNWGEYVKEKRSRQRRNRQVAGGGLDPEAEGKKVFK